MRPATVQPHAAKGTSNGYSQLESCPRYPRRNKPLARCRIAVQVTPADEEVPRHGAPAGFAWSFHESVYRRLQLTTTGPIR